MKNARHEQILKLIGQYDIETQEELAAKLNETGFSVTQATVSRDIRQLQLRKTAGSGGRLRYSAGSDDASSFGERYERVLREAYVSMDISLNILVIHTVSGMAMAAAAALDSFDWQELLGCIAGDDTIIAVLRAPEDARAVFAKIGRIVKQQTAGEGEHAQKSSH